MILGFGFDRLGSGKGKGDGYTGLPYRSEYGIDVSSWYDLNRREQELWIQEFNRTPEQLNYSENSLQRQAFDYVNYIDDKREDIADIPSQIRGAVGYGFDTIALAAVALILLRG